MNKIAEEFLDEIISAAADLASHRGGSVIDVKDILLPLGTLEMLMFTSFYSPYSLSLLERNYDLGVAGFVDSESVQRSLKLVTVN